MALEKHPEAEADVLEQRLDDAHDSGRHGSTKWKSAGPSRRGSSFRSGFFEARFFAGLGSCLHGLLGATRDFHHGLLDAAGSQDQRIVRSQLDGRAERAAFPAQDIP